MDELKQQKIWVCWNRAIKGGSPTKVPCAANGMPTGTNSAYEHTWCTYAEAQKAAQHRGYTGVGFIIPEGYFFLDVDHRSLDDPLVQGLLARFSTYAERSFSGNGLHIYGSCELARLPVQDGKLGPQYYTKNPNNGVELYIGGLANRFAVFTGDAVQDVPLADCTGALLTTLGQDMRRPTVPADIPAPPTTVAAPDDAELFDLICNLRNAKNGEKFSRLFDDGDIAGYGSHSEADAALCAIIAFRTGPNPAAIDAVFRQSALYRPEKWGREDYRKNTIACGIAACRGTFHHNVNRGPRPAFIICDKKGDEHVSTTLLARHIREHLHYFFVSDHALSAVRCYVYQDGVYRLHSHTMLLGVIKQYIAAYNEHLIHTGVLNEVYQLLLTDNDYLSDAALNADEDIINFRNGLLRLSDMALLPHNPDVYSTIQLPCDWQGKEIPTPRFDEYLRTLTNGDEAIQQLLLEFSGMCLSNIRGWRLKKALFMVGPGNTGKSVLKSLVEQLLGKGNFIGIDLAEIEARFGTGSIYGKRLAGSSDMSFLTVAELKTFKKCTGGDSLFAEFKGQNSFEYTYGGLLWFCMNRLPKFGGDDGQWVYDRIIQVPCTAVISDAEQDKHLLDKLLAERDGIVYRMVMALQRVISNGYRLDEPESIKAARQAYREENSTVITFFQDCMTPIPEGQKRYCTVMTVYSAYQSWCRENNRGYAKSAREFRTELAEHLGVAPAELTLRRKEGNVYRRHILTQDAAQAHLHGRCPYVGEDRYADEPNPFADTPDIPDYLL